MNKSLNARCYVDTAIKQMQTRNIHVNQAPIAIQLLHLDNITGTLFLPHYSLLWLKERITVRALLYNTFGNPMQCLY